MTQGGKAAPARLLAGLDEAGRGPVLGPLVVACAITNAPDELHALGVRDSKELTAQAREDLEWKLKGRLRGYALVILEPNEIDRKRRRQSLNVIEGEAFVRAVVEAASSCGIRKIDVVESDAADAVESNFRGMLVRGLARHAESLEVARVIAKHRADSRYPSVSAASILAKVERDRRVRAIAERVGTDIGSGYPSDPVTIAFLRDYIRANRDLPPFARKSWQPAKELLARFGARARTLEQFEEKDVR